MNQKIDYKLIRNIDLISHDLIEWLELDFVDGYCDNFFKDRTIRLVSDKDCKSKKESIFQISFIYDKFDRWSNSVEKEFNINCPKEKNEFIDIIETHRK